jgi:hypothetical protein
MCSREQFANADPKPARRWEASASARHHVDGAIDPRINGRPARLPGSSSLDDI